MLPAAAEVVRIQSSGVETCAVWYSMPSAKTSRNPSARLGTRVQKLNSRIEPQRDSLSVMSLKLRTIKQGAHLSVPLEDEVMEWLNAPSSTGGVAWERARKSSSVLRTSRVGHKKTPGLINVRVQK